MSLIRVIVILSVLYRCLAGESATVLSSVSEQFQALNERVHTLAFDIVFIQIRQQLSQTPKLQVICGESFIGFYMQYLLAAIFFNLVGFKAFKFYDILSVLCCLVSERNMFSF